MLHLANCCIFPSLRRGTLQGTEARCIMMQKWIEVSIDVDIPQLGFAGGHDELPTQTMQYN